MKYLLYIVAVVFMVEVWLLIFGVIPTPNIRTVAQMAALAASVGFYAFARTEK